MTEEGLEQIDMILERLEGYLTKQLSTHEVSIGDIKTIEDERNFYYRKLRLMEESCK
jgi:hypothetical protein